MATAWYQSINATKRYRLGTIKTSIDGSQWLYGKGVASLAVGDWVLFNDATYTPVRMTDTPLTGQVAIAGAANTAATTFSWYMIYGATTNNALSGLVNIATGSTDKVPIAQSSTAGRALGTGVVATKTVVGAFAVGVSAANVGNALLIYPTTAGGSLA